MEHFQQELGAFKERLLLMASHAETTLTQAVEALVTRDDAKALQVRQDDTILDRLEVELDDRAIQLLAKAPLASDLRLITVAMKITQNLERVGDEATQIAKQVLQLNREPALKMAGNVSRVAQMAASMLKESLDTFVNNDSAAARDLIARDKEVDAMNRQLHEELEALMMEHPENIKRCLRLMVICKSLERMADHAKNVAEEVVFLQEAQDIRHLKHRAP